MGVSNVTSFYNGDPVIATAEPRESVIKELEDLLERARSGEVQGVAYAALHSDGLASWGIFGAQGPYSMVGAVEVMKANLLLEEIN